MCEHHTLADVAWAHFGLVVLVASGMWLATCVTAVAVCWLFAQLVARHSRPGGA